MSNDGNDNDQDGASFTKKDNVVSFKVPRQNNEVPVSKEPLINMPPYTKVLLLLFIAIHLIVVFVLNEEWSQRIYVELGFIPGRFTGDALFQPLALLTPLSHMFLHGSWLHLIMNTIMLMAFGSGIERWIGGRRMLILFFASGLMGLALHIALNYGSINPVIGASGGLSGLFAAALVMINRLQGGVQKIWPFILLWIGISVLFGVMGGPDGSAIAWAAHIGGFLGGFVVLRLMRI